VRRTSGGVFIVGGASFSAIAAINFNKSSESVGTRVWQFDLGDIFPLLPVRCSKPSLSIVKSEINTPLGRRLSLGYSH
jgi:hypothetical protein